MTLSRWISCVLFVATEALGCTKLIPGKCDQESDCASLVGTHCDIPTKSCVASTGGNGGAGGAAGKAGAGGAMGGAGGMAGSMAGAGGKPFSCAAANCSGSKPICDMDAGGCVPCEKVPGSCGSRDGGTPFCAPADAGSKGGMCVGCLANSDCKGATPICELGGDAGASRNSCRACASASDCTQLSATTPVCVTSANTAGGAQAGTCVGCVANSDCTSAGGAGTTKPICELTTTNAGASVNTCRKCAKDSECGGPGVCMADGHCAGATEVLFVDETATNCASANGSQTAPFCVLSQGVGALAKNQNVLVILGTVGGRVTLATTGGINPVIIGRKNAAGDAPVIPATNGAGISVSSDTVIIRDITVSGGLTASGTRGVLASGSATVTLLRVTVNLGNGGPGVDAETGATLSMDECYVENNPVGGILVNGATANIQNTIIAITPAASSGYGIQFNAPGSSTQFMFNTIVGYPTSATSDFSHQVTLSYSIVGGTTTNCTLNDCVTPAPTTLSTTYHLTVHQMCPTTPTTFPDHDIDGDLRTSTKLDCGADELVP